MGLFGDLFSTKPAEAAAAAQKAGYQAADTTANSTLAAGQSGADALYGQAYGDFSKLGSKFGAGQDAYNDATGVNGAAGITRAGSTFKSLPGYSGGLTTGIDQAMRTANARGDLGGGNTTADEIKFASDYDANKYGNYISSLAPNLAGATSATAGGAGVLGNEATSNLAVTGQQAQNDYNSNVGQGNAQAQADLAPYGASQNFWSALTGGANMLLKASGVGGYGSATKAVAAAA